MKSCGRVLLALLCVAANFGVARAEVKLPAIIGSHMVLQRDVEAPIWGWAEPGEKVEVRIPERNQSEETIANKDGKWMVKVGPLQVGDPITVVVAGEKNELKLEDVLVGEVWICSGQSNMQWAVQSAVDADLESLAAKHPNLRLIQVRTQGSQEPLSTFNDQWKPCTPETVNALEATLKKAGIKGAIYRYEAEHAFMNEQRTVHDRAAAELAWGRMLKFWEKHLGG